MRISPEPISADDWDEHDWRDLSLPLQIELERMSVPLLQTVIMMWESPEDSDDSISLYPHLQYTCPRCQQIQNVDLHEDDLNPRFASCNICNWDSIAWLVWDYAAARHSQPELLA